MSDYALRVKNVGELNLPGKFAQTKFAIDIQKLKNDIAMLRSKEKAAARQSEIRSTTSGIVHDIRQLYHNNKLQVTFVIRRLETKR